MVKNILFVSGVLLCTSVIGQSMKQRPEISKLIPMTIHSREIVNGEFEFDRAMAIRSDGARVKWSLETGKHNNGLEARTIFLPHERKQVVISDAVKAISTYYQQPFSPQNLVAPSPTCKDVYDDSFKIAGKNEAILGYDTLRFRSDAPSYRGTARRQQVWLAPSLNCRALR
ncbi:MAG: hypothetical protein KIT83_19020, partial [Bryobacterales bacterium]|nr:hypothetical protein [Bryobacterales bacterium]